MEPSAFFEARFKKHLAQLEKRLGRYIDEPEDEKNIHDVRTSLRRIDSMYSVLSKKIRKANKKHSTLYRDFFKANSRVRDVDIIMARLSSLTPEPRPLLQSLQKRRDSLLAHVVEKAKIVRKTERLSINGMNDEEFAARLDKVMRILCESIKENLAMTLEDSANVAELHKLRKYLKKIRYVLESIDAHNAKMYRRRTLEIIGVSLNVELLEKLQDMLGEIHDSDITLEFLKTSRSSAAAELQAKEASRREELYLEFSKYMKSVKT